MNTMLRSCKNVPLVIGTAVLLLLAIPPQARIIGQVLKNARKRPVSRLYIFIPLLCALATAMPAFAHLDAGKHLVITEVVLDKVSMISTDEHFKNEEVRIYTRVHTKGHWKQESFFALPDDSHGGLLKSEWEERGGNLETGEANGNYGSEIGIGHTIYYHVNCEPHEPFLVKLALWDDDSLGLADVKKAVKDILGLSGVPQEVKLWGGAGLAIAGLVEKALASSKDNWSELELGPKNLTGTVTLQTKLRTESYDWKLGDPGADFLFTIKKVTTEQSCGFDGWRTTMNEFIAQLELEKTLRDKLRESYSELLDEVQKEAEESRRGEQESKSPREKSERIPPLEDTLRGHRLAVEVVLDEVHEEWRGPDGILPQERWNDLERLVYWADDTENLSPDRFAQKTARVAATDDPLAPIEVGPRDEVGKKSLGKKAAEKVVGGVLGQILGGGSRRSSRTEGPRTRRDPTRRQDYVELEKPEPEITVGARSRWTDDGLLVSTRISDHDEKGTYHSVYLQSCDGRRLYPRRLEIYDLWAEHSLTVSWTRTTYVDGQVVNRESGGWSDAWSEFLGRHTVNDAELPGIWQMYGYDRAHSGIQQLGAYFNLNLEQLAELGDLALITHITRPEQDPVITEPFNWLLSGDAEQPRLHDPSASIHQVTEAPSHWQHWQEDCQLQDTRSDVEEAQTNDGTTHSPPHPEELESQEPDQEDVDNSSTTSAAPPDDSGSVEVRVISVEGVADARPGDDQEWKQLEEGEVLEQGTELSSGFDGRVLLGVYKDGKLVDEIEINELSSVTIHRSLWEEEAAASEPETEIEFGEGNLDDWRPPLRVPDLPDCRHCGPVCSPGALHRLWCESCLENRGALQRWWHDWFWMPTTCPHRRGNLPPLGDGRGRRG